MFANAKQIALEEIEGTIERIITQFPDGTYVVAVSSDNIPDFVLQQSDYGNFIALGSFARVVEKQRMLLKGKWNNHPRYGWRFMISSYEEVLPKSTDAIIDYLASGLFKGIGRVTAENIVAKFGADTLNIIENEPERLKEVKGIAAKKVQAIVTSYFESKHLQDLMLAFKPYGISNKKLVKIYKKYGKDALKLIRENPYRLCDDFDGIGFLTADAFAKACGIEADNPFRIRAGILYILNENAAGQGHVFLKVNDLEGQLKKLLTRNGENIRTDRIAEVIAEMVGKKELVLEGGDVYLAAFYNCETYIGRKLSRMLTVPPKPFPVDTRGLIAELENKNGIKYADKQKVAFMQFERSNVLIITGGPGTGKTTIIRGILQIFEKNFPDSTIALAAPTGRAAKRMEEATGHEAMTIHRLLEVTPSDDRMYCNRNEDNPIEADLVILDECSMIDLSLFYHFMKAVKPETRLVLVGDVNQLPSVGAGDVFRDLINSRKIPTVYLNEIFRQQNTSKIVINADRINRGQLNLELGPDFEFIQEEDPNNLPGKVKEIYLKELLKNGYSADDIQILTPFRKKTGAGVDSLNKTMQEVINPQAPNKAEIPYGSKTFRVGDKVMQYRNDYGKMVFNGDIGRITKIEKTEDGSQLITVMIDGNEVIYERDDLADLELAYASTIHKSQGSEYSVVIIPMTMQHYILLQRNLLYTAVTRAKGKVIIVGERRAVICAIRNDLIRARNSKLDQRII